MNSWNKKLENGIMVLGSKSGAYRMMHDEASSYYSNFNKVISIISIFLITLTGTSAFSVAFIEEGTVYKIIIGCVLYIVGVLTSIKEFLNLTEISDKHKLYSIRFSALYHNIQRQIALEPIDRQDGKDYIGWINSEFDNLLFSNPDIPDKIKKNALNKFGDILNNDIIQDLSFHCKINDNESILDESKDEVQIRMEPENLPKNKDNSRSRYEIDRYMQLR